MKPIDEGATCPQQDPDLGPTPESGEADTAEDRVRNEPTSGLWVFAVLAVVLFSIANWTDPGRRTPTCVRSLADLPGIDLEALPICTEAPTSAGPLILHLVLVATYIWFFRECVRWGYRCLGWKAGRRFLIGWGTALVYMAVIVDIAALVVVTVEERMGSEHVSTPYLTWLKLLFFAPNLLIAAVVLLTGLRRFALPWTVPVSHSARVEDGLARPLPTSDPEPIPGPQGVEGKPTRWFAGPDRTVYPTARYGVGLSGGGVRSAAFCSGVLQSLAGTRWSPSEAEYLATVSGGGYVGVSSQIIRHPLGDVESVDGLDPYAGQAPETRGFAERHRYLGDDALERAQVLLALLTGWILNAALVAGPIVVIGTGLAVLPKMPAVQPVAIAVMLAAAGLLLLSGAEGSLDRIVSWRAAPEELSGMPAKITAAAPTTGALETWAKRARWLAGLFVVLGSLGIAVSTTFSGHWLWWTGGFAVSGGVFYLFANRLKRPSLQNVARTLFVAGWASVGLIGIAYSASGRLGNPTSWAALNSSGHWLVAWIAAAVALITAFFLLDQTSWSPHPFYKARLAATFSMRRIREGARTTFQVMPFGEYTYLDEWASPAARGPKLLVCATANAEDISLPPKGTRAVPFVFSYDHVGSPELGWWTTKDFRRCLGRNLAGDGTLQAATAISGAAVASGLGVQGRIPSVGTALALLNARLGVWLPNPHVEGAAHRWPDDDLQPTTWLRRWQAAWPRRRRPHWLWREVAGFLPSNKRFIYVSDGGHLDNLGLLELLRRRTEVILVVDASADEKLTTNTLDGVCTLAAEHLGVTFARDTGKPLCTPAQFDTRRSRSKVRGVAKDCVEVVRFTYPKFDGEERVRTGILVVAKARFAASLRGDEDAERVVQDVEASGPPPWWPWSLRSLPTTLTANQSLTDDQFGAYVQLGRAVGRRAVHRLDEVAGSAVDESGEQPAEGGRLQPIS